MIAVVDDEEPMALEGLRRMASWLAGATFGAAFVGLLVLSAGSEWSPDNPWVRLFDQLWKTSGLVFVGLAALPYAVAIVRRLRSLF